MYILKWLNIYLVFGGNTENTVDIDFESDFELWDTTGSWWDTGKIEFTQQVVILGHWTFSLIDLEMLS